jgi:hypothetical protein
MSRTGWLLIVCLGCGPGAGSSFPAPAGDAAMGGSPGSDDASSSAAGSDDDGASHATDDSGAFGVSDAFAGTQDCTPGTYVGTYQGTNDSSKVGGPTDFPISGPMDLNLVRMQTSLGESELVTNNGSFEMTWGGTGTGDAAVGLVVVQAAITGQLDCSTDSFSAMSTSATWTLIGINAGTANLSFAGTYDPSSQAISGTFNVTDSLSTSTGTWTVMLTPSGDP